MAKAIAYLIDAQISYSGMCQIYWKWSSVNAAISVTRFGKKISSLWLKFIDKNKPTCFDNCRYAFWQIFLVVKGQKLYK